MHLATNHIFQTLVEHSSAGPSSLLIPEALLDYFKGRCSDCGSRAAYFHFLAARYLPRLREGIDELSRWRTLNWNTCYQAKSQSLQKKNFRPRGEDWESFRLAAASCGVSICFLFVFLMTLEMQNFFENPPYKNPGRWNSFLKWVISKIKFRKFIKFERVLDQKRQSVRRKIKIQ